MSTHNKHDRGGTDGSNNNVQHPRLGEVGPEGGAKALKSAAPGAMREEEKARDVIVGNGPDTVAMNVKPGDREPMGIVKGVPEVGGEADHRAYPNADPAHQRRENTAADPLLADGEGGSFKGQPEKVAAHDQQVAKQNVVHATTNANAAASFDASQREGRGAVPTIPAKGSATERQRADAVNKDAPLHDGKEGRDGESGSKGHKEPTHKHERTHVSKK